MSSKITGERIATLRKKRSWTQPMLAKKMNVSQSTVTMWENSKRAISSEDLSRLAQLFKVSTDYLLGLSTEDASKPVRAEFESATTFVPVYGEIHAGAASWAEQNVIGRVPINEDLVFRYGEDNLFALRIIGDSMNRVLLNGYVAIFAKDTSIENGDIVAVLIDHEDATIKYFKQTSAAVIFEPNSTYAEYQPYFFPKSQPQDFQILGKFLYATTQLM